jgi:NAD(P)-dependent dehydrogenase (short-subunit alcohol dehydrogenase family)
MGRAIAALYARAGANVVMTGRTRETGHAARAAIEESGGKAIFVTADQGSNADWLRVIEETHRAFGRLDILVANAGQSFPVPTKDMSLEDFRRLNTVNLKGVFLGLKHAAESIRRHGEGGAIVLIASIVGKIGAPGFIHYSASKGGVRLMAKAAALELGAEKIRVNSIHPGFVRTDLSAMFDEKTLAPLVPLGRFGEPEDIANAALFLASKRGQFITGSELVIDGGWTVQ